MDQTDAAGPPRQGASDGGLPPVILIVGNPNVGKSALFNRLTGRYVTVSNYPGTTVEVSRGPCIVGGQSHEVIDTPGMYSLLPITEEERVARDCLLRSPARAVIHVIDAKNIERMLGLTLQLAEAGLPVVVALNMFDEARALGILIDSRKLEAALGIPVVPTVSVTGEGIAELIERAAAARPAPAPRIDYGPALGGALDRLAQQLGGGAAIGARARASLLLQGDVAERERAIRELGDEAAARVFRTASDAAAPLEHSAHYHVTLSLKHAVDGILSECVVFPDRRRPGLREALDRICMSPVTGFPLLLLVLYFGLYRFVGGFGAGVLVGWIEENVFGSWLNPWVVRLAADWIPWAPVRDLVAGEYGIVTLGVRYAMAIVLPIVGAFFLVFSILEDSGYLPRLAMLIDRVLKRIGLNGRAVIPLVLGFGCDTMATIVTRTLESTRERLICTFLLALAIPCSAQLGVILGLLGGHPLGMAIWAGVVTAVFLAAGALMARFLPGERPVFYMELPPLRLPRLGNVLVKTYSRMVWYFKEVLPLFVLASVLIWIGQITAIFPLLVRGLSGVVGSIGLPDGAAVAFLFGFFRRDYGVAGLYDLQKHGGLTGNQLVVAAITLTLFLPCVAQFLVMSKERGMKLAVLASVAITAIAFAAGFVVNGSLVAFGVNL